MSLEILLSAAHKIMNKCVSHIWQLQNRCKTFDPDDILIDEIFVHFKVVRLDLISK